MVTDRAAWCVGFACVRACTLSKHIALGWPPSLHLGEQYHGYRVTGVEVVASCRPAVRWSSLAAALRRLIDVSAWISAGLGLAIVSAIARCRTGDLLSHHEPAARAPVGGFSRAVWARFLVAAAFIVVRATNAPGEPVSEAMLETLPVAEVHDRAD